MPIRRILIANRGEIVARVIRSSKVLGIETILAASEIDLDSEPARIVAKIIGYGPDRSSPLERLRRAIGQSRVEGVANNLSFDAAVLADPEFARGGVDTRYVPRLLQRQRLGPESIVHA
jgi:acetyl/propionyl-CoA carboxylase alpha subunit